MLEKFRKFITQERHIRISRRFLLRLAVFELSAENQYDFTKIVETKYELMGVVIFKISNPDSVGVEIKKTANGSDFFEPLRLVLTIFLKTFFQLSRS